MTETKSLAGVSYSPAMTLPSTVRLETVAERAARGKAARERRPRTTLASWQPSESRLDPVDLLAQQEVVRVQELLPLRHSRMSASAFAFYRGGATVMAHDLGGMPNSGLVTQLCGDAHLANFGVFGAPDRSLVFDINDFDETHPGPFEWDVLRLATSFVLAARDNGMPAQAASDAALAVGNAYRTQMATFAGMSDLDAWYMRVAVDDILALAEQIGLGDRKRMEKAAAKAKSRTSWSAIAKMTEVADGSRRFLDLPPLLMPATLNADAEAVVVSILDQYRSTLPHDRQHLLLRYHSIDLAHKVVGVGSVGLLAFVLLMQGRDENDLIVLQAKQAVESVLAPFTAPSAYGLAGERVVVGQQLMQAASDIFLGWTRGTGGRDFYVRQLRDMKFAPDPATMDASILRGYAMLCGGTLARAHARGGDAVAIAAYLGTSDKFDRAVHDFAQAYADQVGHDYAGYKAAIADGRVSLGDQAEEARYQLSFDTKSGIKVTARPVTTAPAVPPAPPVA